MSKSIYERLPRWYAHVPAVPDDNSVVYGFMVRCCVSVLDGDDTSSLTINAADVHNMLGDFATVADWFATQAHGKET